MEAVSTLEGLTLRQCKWLAILLNVRPESDQVYLDMLHKVDVAGEKVGNVGRVVKVYKDAAQTAIDCLCQKRWPSEIRKRFCDETHAFMLVIENNFDEFDPSVHQWRLIWFKSAQSKRKSLSHFMDAVLTGHNWSDNPFHYLDWITADSPHQTFGSVSSPDNILAEVRKRPNRRPNVMDEEYGVWNKITEYIDQDIIVPTGKSWMKDLRTRLLRDLQNIPCKTDKGLHRALNREGVYIRIIDQSALK